MKILLLLALLLPLVSTAAEPTLLWRAEHVDGAWRVTVDRLDEAADVGIPTAGLPVSLLSKRNGPLVIGEIQVPCRCALVRPSGDLEILSPREGEFHQVVPDYANSRFYLLVEAPVATDPRLVPLEMSERTVVQQLEPDRFALHQTMSVRFFRPSTGVVELKVSDFNHGRLCRAPGGRFGMAGRSDKGADEVRIYEPDGTLLYQAIAPHQGVRYSDLVLNDAGTHAEYTEEIRSPDDQDATVLRADVDLESGVVRRRIHPLPGGSLRPGSGQTILWGERFLYCLVERYREGAGWRFLWDSPQPWAMGAVLSDGRLALLEGATDDPDLVLLEADGMQLARIPFGGNGVNVSDTGAGLLVLLEPGQTSIVRTP